MKEKPEHTPATVLQVRWNALLRARKACLQHDDLETVHDLRVATRRLRSALQTFTPFCQGKQISRVSSAIRRMTRGVGALRDLDEAILFFQTELSAASGSAVLFGSLLEMLHRRRVEESAVVARLLKKLDVKSISSFLEHLDQHLPSAHRKKLDSGEKLMSLPGYLSETSISLFSNVDYLLPFAQTPEAVETRHRLRIAIKHWRYFLEIVADISDQNYGQILEILKQYQSVLGTLNDLSVFTGLADDFGLTAEERKRFTTLVSIRTELFFNKFIELVKQTPLRYQFLF